MNSAKKWKIEEEIVERIYWLIVYSVIILNSRKNIINKRYVTGKIIRNNRIITEEEPN